MLQSLLTSPAYMTMTVASFLYNPTTAGFPKSFPLEELLRSTYREKKKKISLGTNEKERGVDATRAQGICLWKGETYNQFKLSIVNSPPAESRLFCPNDYLVHDFDENNTQICRIACAKEREGVVRDR